METKKKQKSWFIIANTIADPSLIILIDATNTDDLAIIHLHKTKITQNASRNLEGMMPRYRLAQDQLPKNRDSPGMDKATLAVSLINDSCPLCSNYVLAVVVRVGKNNAAANRL